MSDSDDVGFSPLKKKKRCGIQENDESLKRPIIPFLGINKYIRSWRICGICYHNEGIRDCHRFTQVLSFYLMDANGSSVKVTAFGIVALKIQKKVRKRCVYYLKGTDFCIREKNTRHNRSSMDYEIFMNETCELDLCIDRVINMPEIVISKNFIKEISKNLAEVDIAAIIHQVGELESVKLYDGTIFKRDITLVDPSMFCISLVTWDKMAKNPIGMKGDAIMIKYAKVKFWEGSLTLSWYGYTQYAINPEQVEVINLKNWYTTTGSKSDFTPLSRSFKPLLFEDEGRTLAAGIAAAKRNIKEVVRFTSKVEIVEVDTRFAIYRGCVDDQKKLSIDGDKFTCLQCNKIQDGKYYLMLKVVLCDATNVINVAIYDELAQKLLGTTAQKLQEIYEKNEEEFRHVLQRILFQSFFARIRSSFDTKSSRLKFAAIDLKEVSYEDYHNVLDHAIEKLSAI